MLRSSLARCSLHPTLGVIRTSAVEGSGFPWNRRNFAHGERVTHTGIRRQDERTKRTFGVQTDSQLARKHVGANSASGNIGISGEPALRTGKSAERHKQRQGIVSHRA